MKMSVYALFVCVAPVFVFVFVFVLSRRRGREAETEDEMRFAISSVHPGPLSPERPFTVVNHLHGDILKLGWMGSCDASQTWL